MSSLRRSLRAVKLLALVAAVALGMTDTASGDTLSDHLATQFAQQSGTGWVSLPGTTFSTVMSTQHTSDTLPAGSVSADGNFWISGTTSLTPNWCGPNRRAISTNNGFAHTDTKIWIAAQGGHNSSCQNAVFSVDLPNMLIQREEFDSVQRQSTIADPLPYPNPYPVGGYLVRGSALTIVSGATVQLTAGLNLSTLVTSGAEQSKLWISQATNGTGPSGKVFLVSSVNDAQDRVTLSVAPAGVTSSAWNLVPNVPNSQHGYDADIYHPGTNRVYKFGGRPYADVGEVGAPSDKIDADIWYWDVATETWTWVSAYPFAIAAFKATAAVLLENGNILVFDDNSAREYTPATNTFVERASLAIGQHVADLDPTHDEIVLIDKIAGPAFRFRTISTVDWVVRSYTHTGSLPPIDCPYQGGHSYDIPRDAWFYWGGGSTCQAGLDATSVWRVDLDRNTLIATWTQQTYASGPTGQSLNISVGVENKWYYNATYDVHLGLNNAFEPVWAFRPSTVGTVLPPNANNDQCTTSGSTPCVGNVLSNDSDPNVPPLPLSATLVAGSGPEAGTLVLNPGGAFTYTPTSPPPYQDQFSYRATNSGNQNDVASVLLTVNVGGNDPPVLENDAFNVVYGTSPSYANTVATNDTNDDGAIIYTLDDPPDHGSVVVSANGSFLYTLQEIYWGNASFTVRGVDQANNSDLSQVTLSIACSGDTTPPPSTPGTPGVCP